MGIKFETYINGFLDLEYPNFDPKHGFLSSVEAEIISFCQIRQPFRFLAFYVHLFIFKMAPHSKLINRTLRLVVREPNPEFLQKSILPYTVNPLDFFDFFHLSVS